MSLALEEGEVFVISCIVKFSGIEQPQPTVECYPEAMNLSVQSCDDSGCREFQSLHRVSRNSSNVNYTCRTIADGDVVSVWTEQSPDVICKMWCISVLTWRLPFSFQADEQWEWRENHACSYRGVTRWSKAGVAWKVFWGQQSDCIHFCRREVYKRNANYVGHMLNM